MNLRFLRTFVAIADHAGVARAAARLNLTQSAASRQIQSLENELGLRLFARIGRNVRLTREGEDLLARSRRLLADAAALGERASALKSGEVGVLRLGATPQVIENSARGVVAALPQASPWCRGSSGRGRRRSATGPPRARRYRRGRHAGWGGSVLRAAALSDACPGRIAAASPLEPVLGTRCHRACRRPAAAAHIRFCLAWLVRGCLPRRACAATRAARKRRAADVDRIGPSRPRHCGGSFSGSDSTCRRSCGGGGASRRTDRTMGGCSLGAAAIPATLCRAVHRTTGRALSARLSRPRLCPAGAGAAEAKS